MNVIAIANCLNSVCANIAQARLDNYKSVSNEIFFDNENNIFLTYD